MNKHIKLVKKWLADKDSVSQQELEDNRNAAYAAAADAADAADYAAYAAYYAADDNADNAAYWTDTAAYWVESHEHDIKVELA